eukprot:GHVU01008994.1.p1 GENE.GHVU01008994.1~~GHVU01008994.1.p1  ORF type:complete len:127 (-),score=11.52 GHVU01008994.1:15-395(-)
MSAPNAQSSAAEAAADPISGAYKTGAAEGHTKPHHHMHACSLSHSLYLGDYRITHRLVKTRSDASCAGGRDDLVSGPMPESLAQLSEEAQGEHNCRYLVEESVTPGVPLADPVELYVLCTGLAVAT